MPAIEIALLRRDGGTQPRAAIDERVVAEYANELDDGAEFPPVIVFYDGSDYWLADGFHRVDAYVRASRTTIAADVRQGTRRDAVLFSVGANALHGQRRTNADKRRAVETLLRDEEWSQWSDRDISRRAAVHHSFVARIRAELSVACSQMQNPPQPLTKAAAPAPLAAPPVRLAERNGKVYPINTGRIGSAISKVAPQAKKLLADSGVLSDRKQLVKLSKLPRETQVGVAERIAFGDDSTVPEAMAGYARAPWPDTDRFQHVLRLALKLTIDEQRRLSEKLLRHITRHDGDGAPGVQ